MTRYAVIRRLSSAPSSSAVASSARGSVVVAALVVPSAEILAVRVVVWARSKGQSSNQYASISACSQHRLTVSRAFPARSASSAVASATVAAARRATVATVIATSAPAAVVASAVVASAVVSLSACRRVAVIGLQGGRDCLVELRAGDYKLLLTISRKDLLL